MTTMMPSKDRSVRRSLGLLWSSSGHQTIINIIVVVIRSVVPLAAVFLIKYFIDTIAGSPGAIATHVTAGILGMITAIALTLLADDLLSSLGSYTSKKQAYLLEKHISSLIHQRTASLGLSFFEDPAYHDKLSRAVRDISWRPAGVVSDIMLLLRGIISFAAMAVVLHRFSIFALVILVIAFIPVLWIKAGSSGLLYSVRRDMTPASRQASYFSWLLTAERPAREVKLFNLNSFFDNQYKKNFSASRTAELTVIRRSSSLEVLASIIKVLAFSGVLIYASLSFIDTKITAGEMAMYLVAFRQAMIYLRDTVTGVSGLLEDRLFIKDLFIFLDMESNIISDKKAQGIHSFNEIEVRDISFTYPGAPGPALKNVSLKIKRGEKVAVVGPNGSGKTTLVKILCRLYDPDSGSIELGGVNIDQFDPNEYRQLFSVVFQDYMLYYLSAAENIGLNDMSDERSEERVKEAAMKSGIAGLLEKLPEGYNTLLGHHTEGGRELSWGEWQKIAIARALYRDSPVLVLDEPSSSLDADSEYEFFSRLGDITDGKTTILISHRLSNVSDADRIIVLDGGEVTETGSHDELIAMRGRYYSMFNRQKNLYR